MQRVIVPILLMNRISFQLRILILSCLMSFMGLGVALADIVVNITSPANGAVILYGDNFTINATATEANGTINSVSFYSNGTLLGTSTSAPYSFTWNQWNFNEAQNFTLTAVATDANGNSATSAPVTIDVVFPTVTITNPTNNSIVQAGSNLSIVANATENGSYSNINTVYFSSGSTFLGSTSIYPFTFVWNNIPEGNYTITAVATGSQGGYSTSPPVNFTVEGQPQVNIVSPPDNSTYAINSICITASASENAGVIAKVDFYDGQNFLATETSNNGSYTYAWNNIPPGTHEIIAVATDIEGVKTTSSASTLTINTPHSSGPIDSLLASATDPLGNTTSYTYDNLKRLTRINFADGSKISYTYDLFGNLTRLTDQRLHQWVRAYDAYERLFQIKDPNGGVTQFNYDFMGNLLTLTDANKNRTNFKYDADNRVLSQSNALNYTSSFTYDPVGNIASKTDANSKTTSYTYDALNHLTGISYPDGSSLSAVYDAVSRLTSFTDSTGQTSYTYDPLGRVLTAASPAGQTITYTYDSEGNRASTVDQSGRTITNTYDALNRLSTVTYAFGKTTYFYDADSNLISAQNGGINQYYTYNALNRISSAVDSSLWIVKDQYDIAGMVTKKTYLDGTSMVYQYDALNQLLSETKNNSSAKALYSNTYSYDPVGNRLVFAHNETLGRFWQTDSSSIPNVVLKELTSAGYGQYANPNQSIALERDYVVDHANRLTSWEYSIKANNLAFEIDSNNYTYDRNGNRLTKKRVVTGDEGSPEETTYGYDFENRLNSIKYVGVPGMTSPQYDYFTYNGEGLRVASNLNSSVRNYYYDESNISDEYSGDNQVLAPYVRGIDSPGGIRGLITDTIPIFPHPRLYYYLYDDLGSVIGMSAGGSGGIEYSYDAYGNLAAPQAATDTNRYLFSTKEFDRRSGLYYFGARYYDPEIGRWLTPDPLGFVNGPNMYAYVDNNPINEIDPYGLFSWNRGWREAIKGVVKGGTAGWLLGQFGGPLVPYTGPEGAGLGALLGGAGGFINGAWADENPVVANALGTSLQGAVGGPAGAVIGGIGGAVGGLTSCPERNTPDNAGLNGIISGVAGGLVSGPGGAIESGGQGVIDGYIDGFINYLEGRNTNKSAQ